MQITIGQSFNELCTCIRADLVGYLLGSPACGKSDIVRKVADQFKLELIDVRLSQSDPTDLNGFAMPNRDHSKGVYLPMDTFPVEGDELPEGKHGWLIFFDELPSAARATQAACFKIMLDKMVGIHKLHPNVRMVAAGNRKTDGGIVNPISTPMQSRLLTYDVSPDLEEWCVWAAENQLDHRIISFLRYKPGLLYRFDPNHNEYTFPAPRTWSFMNRILKIRDNVSSGNRASLSACVGDGAANEFIEYCKVYKDLVSYKEIMDAPDKTEVPAEPGTLYALSGLLEHKMDPDNIENLMIYIERMPPEFQIITLKNAGIRNPKLVNNKCYLAWAVKAAELLM